MTIDYNLSDYNLSDCTLNFVQFANCSLLESIVVANKTRLIKNRLDVYDRSLGHSHINVGISVCLKPL